MSVLGPISRRRIILPYCMPLCQGAVTNGASPGVILKCRWFSPASHISYLPLFVFEAVVRWILCSRLLERTYPFTSQLGGRFLLEGSIAFIDCSTLPKVAIGVSCPTWALAFHERSTVHNLTR